MSTFRRDLHFQMSTFRREPHFQMSTCRRELHFQRAVCVCRENTGAVLCPTVTCAGFSDRHKRRPIGAVSGIITYPWRWSKLRSEAGIQKVDFEPRLRVFKLWALFLGRSVKVDRRSYRKRVFKKIKSGNAVYYTNALLLPVRIIMCSKLHCQIVFEF